MMYNTLLYYLSNKNNFNNEKVDTVIPNDVGNQNIKYQIPRRLVELDK